MNKVYEWQKLCKKEIIENYKKNFDKEISDEDVYVVWSCKTLQNCKALFSTSIDGDGVYIECTYNGDKDETYMDVYKKLENICFCKKTS